MKTKAAMTAALILGVIFMLNKDSLPRGIRNNNPMNIRENDGVDFEWDGESLFDSDLAFEEFKSPLWGIRAGARILRTYRNKYGLDTISGIITKWAPPSENETDSYIKSVSESIGIPPAVTLYDEDYPALIAAIIKHENGSQPYSMELIKQGFAMGFAS